AYATGYAARTLTGDTPALDRDLSRDAFLQLLVTQLRYQNPLSPVDDRAFLAELAQFSMLERIQELKSVVTAAQHLQGIGLLGRRVVLQDGTGGLVTAVTLRNDGPVLSLDWNRDVRLSEVATVYLESPVPAEGGEDQPAGGEERACGG